MHLRALPTLLLLAGCPASHELADPPRVGEDAGAATGRLSGAWQAGEGVGGCIDYRRWFTADGAGRGELVLLDANGCAPDRWGLSVCGGPLRWDGDTLRFRCADDRRALSVEATMATTDASVGRPSLDFRVLRRRSADRYVQTFRTTSTERQPAGGTATVDLDFTVEVALSPAAFARPEGTTVDVPTRVRSDSAGLRLDLALTGTVEVVDGVPGLRVVPSDTAGAGVAALLEGRELSPEARSVAQQALFVRVAPDPDEPDLLRAAGVHFFPVFGVSTLRPFPEGLDPCDAYAGYADLPGYRAYCER